MGHWDSADGARALCCRGHLLVPLLFTSGFRACTADLAAERLCLSDGQSFTHSQIFFKVNFLWEIGLRRTAQESSQESLWGWVDILGHVDGVISCVNLAFLSGILWQSSPPAETDAETESKARLRGLSSMASFLEAGEEPLYHAKIETRPVAFWLVLMLFAGQQAYQVLYPVTQTLPA